MSTAKKKSGTGSGQSGSAKSPNNDNRVVASNRRARHDYEIIESTECGIVLQGSEVKSLRAGRIALQDAYARIIDGEMWLFGVHVPPYAQANGFGAHDPDRRRKLLLHRRQIDEWMGRSRSISTTGGPRSSWPWPGVAGSTTSAMPSPPGMPVGRQPGRPGPLRGVGPIGDRSRPAVLQPDGSRRVRR
jgi:SsrA-binding protein